MEDNEISSEFTRITMEDNESSSEFNIRPALMRSVPRSTWYVFRKKPIVFLGMNILFLAIIKTLSTKIYDFISSLDLTYPIIIYYNLRVVKEGITPDNLSFDNKTLPLKTIMAEERSITLN